MFYIFNTVLRSSQCHCFLTLQVFKLIYLVFRHKNYSIAQSWAKKNKRKKRSTQILTNTHVRNKIFVNRASKCEKSLRKRSLKFSKHKRNKTKIKKKNKHIIESSEEESDIEVEFSDENYNKDFNDDVNKEDFVIVKVMGKRRTLNYVAKVDK